MAERSVYLAVGVSPNDLESEPFQGQAGPGSGWQRPEQWLGAGSGERGPFQEGRGGATLDIEAAAPHLHGAPCLVLNMYIYNHMCTYNLIIFLKEVASPFRK